MTDTCWWCKGRLCWDQDYSAEDVYGTGIIGIVTLLHCSSCGARVSYELIEDDAI